MGDSGVGKTSDMKEFPRFVLYAVILDIMKNSARSCLILRLNRSRSHMVCGLDGGSVRQSAYYSELVKHFPSC